MEKIAWVTDSTATLDEELVNHPDVYSVPMIIYFDNEEYLDGINISFEEFYTKLTNSDVPPKTSQPSVGTFAELYNKLSENYDRIISIHLSKHLSGTISSSTQAAELVEIPVHTVDSKVLSYPLSAMVKKAISLYDKGHHAEEIISKLEEMTDKNETYVLIGSLEQLHRSGRMTGLQKFLGSLLQIKPIIAIEDGKLDVADRVRTDKKAVQRLHDLLDVAVAKGTVKEVFVLHGRDIDPAIDIKNTIEAKYPDLQTRLCPLSTTIAVHAGVNTVGVSWYHE